MPSIAENEFEQKRDDDEDGELHDGIWKLI